jgi:hypothetical protein
VESVEAAGIGNKLRPFCLEHLPDRLAIQLRMMMRFGVDNAFVEQPSVQLVVVLEPKPRREEPFAPQSHLVLDLPFFPARCVQAIGSMR